MKTIMQVKNIYKNYGKNEVLKGICFDVKKTERIGILGANGARKNYIGRTYLSN